MIHSWLFGSSTLLHRRNIQGDIGDMSPVAETLEGTANIFVPCTNLGGTLPSTRKFTTQDGLKMPKKLNSLAPPAQCSLQAPNKLLYLL